MGRNHEHIASSDLYDVDALHISFANTQIVPYQRSIRRIVQLFQLCAHGRGPAHHADRYCDPVDLELCGDLLGIGGNDCACPINNRCQLNHLLSQKRGG